MRQDHRPRGADRHRHRLRSRCWWGGNGCRQAILHRRCCSSRHDATLYAGGLPDEQQATLILFSDWFKATFPRVEAVREAKRQVEFDFGQTQALEHHNADFNELLEKLPGNNLLAQATHIDHYLSSLSESLPAELAEKTPPTLPGRPSGARGGDDDNEMEGM